MYKLLITGGRSFIVPEEDVVKGGKKRTYTYSEGTTTEIELAPGKGVYEVTDECGKFLETFQDVNVIEKIKDQHVGVIRKPQKKVHPPNQDTLQDQLIKAMAEIQRLSALIDKKQDKA